MRLIVKNIHEEFQCVKIERLPVFKRLLSERYCAVYLHLFLNIKIQTEQTFSTGSYNLYISGQNMWCIPFRRTWLSGIKKPT